MYNTNSLKYKIYYKYNIIYRMLYIIIYNISEKMDINIFLICI